MLMSVSVDKICDISKGGVLLPCFFGVYRIMVVVILQLLGPSIIKILMLFGNFF